MMVTAVVIALIAGIAHAMGFAIPDPWRRVVIAIVAGGTAWGVSFFIADYVAKASITGITTAVQGLQGSVNALTGSIDQVNARVMEESRNLRSDRDQLAKSIADKVAEHQRAVDGSQTALTLQLGATNNELKNLTFSINSLRDTVKGVDDRLTVQSPNLLFHRPRKQLGVFN